MAGLGPAIHVLVHGNKDVECADKLRSLRRLTQRGHDEGT